MRFEFSITVPEDLTETHRRFIMDRIQDEARYIHKLLWPGQDYSTDCGFTSKPTLRQMDEIAKPYKTAVIKRPFEDIRFGTRDEARRVVDAIATIINNHANVTVADIYDLCGLPTTRTDQEFGWTDLGAFTLVDLREENLVALRADDPERLF